MVVHIVVEVSLHVCSDLVTGYGDKEGGGLKCDSSLGLSSR